MTRPTVHILRLLRWGRTLAKHGALRGIDADFGLKLHGPDCALAATIGGLTGK